VKDVDAVVELAPNNVDVTSASELSSFVIVQLLNVYPVLGVAAILIVEPLQALVIASELIFVVNEPPVTLALVMEYFVEVLSMVGLLAGVQTPLFSVGVSVNVYSVPHAKPETVAVF
jgi:hypothetical protein